MERPKVKDYYWKNATLVEVAETYNKAPNLFKYAQALDMYIDDLEDKLSEQQTPTEANNDAETKQLIIGDVSGSYSVNDMEDAYDKGFKDAMVKYRE